MSVTSEARTPSHSLAYPATWERVGIDGFRMMVPDGWLFCLAYIGSGDVEVFTAPCFIPDAGRLWYLGGTK